MKKYMLTIVVCVFSLLDLGLVMLGRSGTSALSVLFWPQVAWIGAGMLLMVVAAQSDYRIWRGYAGVLVAIVVCLLAGVLVPNLGTKLDGARRTFNVSGVRLEPASLSKLAVVIFLAAHLARRSQLMNKFPFGSAIRLKHLFRKFYGGVLIPVLVVAAIVLLVIAEPHISAGLLVVVVAIIVMLAGGMRCWWIGLMGATGVAGLFGSAYYDPVRWRRCVGTLASCWEGRARCEPMAYRVLHSCGWTGAGLWHGQLRGLLSPGEAGDFVTVIISEELGWCGLLGMLAAMALFVVAGLHVSRRAGNRFGFLLGVGIVSLIGCQTLMSVAAHLNLFLSHLLPVPFVSYGGADLCVMLIGIGLLLSIARQADEGGSRARPHADAPDPAIDCIQPETGFFPARLDRP